MTASTSYFNPFGWIPDDWRFPPEVELAGFYLTPIFFVIAAALLLGVVTAWVADRLSLSRFIWHPPLFLIALIFIYGFVLTLMFLPQ
ncbi:DUF1656 domain-containing protein [Rubellicoccus peritrichatus]|uniref:DUF1656 domain-containing protein n=1 Tax=Rubellicoccus peritrichatus TaxID=3080537 RepID=A0AAQ3LA87_9BACT|nr:DUF1656 domain-containing protein [Puniceicoccus sp. CR14]WOO39763.1 DUF1656 domain-containing protein [Puniceicoccus sp. CR14]